MPEVTRRRTGEMLRTLFEFLIPMPEGMQARDALVELEKRLTLSPYEQGEYESGGRRFEKIVTFATVDLTKAGWLLKDRGRWTVTQEGRQAYETFTDPETFYKEAVRLFHEWKSQQPEDLEARETLLENKTPAVFNSAEGAWTRRPGFAERIRQNLETIIPNEAVRHEALNFLAFAIENADEERRDAWYLRVAEQKLRLMTGRLLACEIRRTKMKVTVIGPVSEDVRNALGAEREDDWEFKWIPGSLLLSFPIEHAAQANTLLKDSFNSFVDEAMARVRRAVSLEEHAPEAVDYIAAAVGRELPQPTPVDSDAESADDAADEEEALASREPKIRGRVPIFEPGQRSIASLMDDVHREVIALPDLQRPFVWEDTKVRDLLDSLFVGFPVGTLVFWHPTNEKEARALGAEKPGLQATTLVIDGQQRLTSLFAVMKGAEVIGKDGEPRRITIAFRPRDGKFEVADAAIRKDPEFLPDASELWLGRRSKPQIRRDLKNNLQAKGRTVSEQYEEAAERNLDRAHAIADYRFPTVDIRKTSSTPGDEITDEDVAEIFVRINNQGTKLGQADFVLTLLSVYHGELRDRFEQRSLSMSSDAVVGIDTQQLLRAVCGVAFGRARMSAVYRFLRGIDPTTGEADTAGRMERLRQLDNAATECMELTPWRDYLLRVKHAGFVNEGLIASKNAIVNAYAFYIRGRKVGVAKSKLDELIARWLFASLLTARYSGSSESAFEQDLARVGRLEPSDAEGFVRELDEAMGETLTGDFWTHTLVASLETQKGRSPGALAFRAAQVVLGTRALFSDQLLQNLLSSTGAAARAAGELHHLFPKIWLQRRGIEDRRIINQVANLAHVGWHENSVIGSSGPAEYVPKLRESLALDDHRWGRMCAEHALPPGWEKMDYTDFLRERRRRMAEIIRVAFRQLGGEAGAAPVTPPWFLPGSEEVWQSIADTERTLRALVRDLYVARFADHAAEKIERTLSEGERESLSRALRARPSGADSLSVIDYLYLAQLPVLIFAGDIWNDARTRLGWPSNAKQKLQEAISQIAPVRNEIAHVREIDPDRLLRAKLACNEVIRMVAGERGTAN